MSYIPNVREKVVVPAFSRTGEPEENQYWEGFLDEEDSREIEGYDRADVELGTLFLGNLTMFDEYKELLGLTENDELPFESDLMIDERSILDIPDEDLKKYSKVEIMARVFYEVCSIWLESHRNEWVTAKIDGYSDEKMDLIKKRVAGGYKNAILRFKELIEEPSDDTEKSKE